jgi:ribosomal-protein-alanine N-acetyltransferase
MVEIETARLRLRPMTLDDAEVYHQQIWSQPEVMRYLPGNTPRPRDYSDRVINYFNHHWQQRDFGMWAAICKESGQFIGHCGLQTLETGEVEVAYAFAQPFWGQGLATEGAFASLYFGFEEVKLDRIIALAFPENIASRRVMEKIGMKYERITQYFNCDLAYYTIAVADFVGGDTPPYIGRRV